MFTTGSKYYLGLSGVAAIVGVVYMIFVNPNDIGALSLFMLATAAATVAGFSLFTRDNEVESIDEAREAAQRAPGGSIWPIVTALGAAIVLVGLATIPAWFIIGLAVLCAGGLEWMIQGWAERASADAKWNEDVRIRVIGGLEFPGLAAVVLVLIAYAFSRIMLNASKNGATVIFMVVATVVLVVGSMAALKPGFRGRVVASITAVGAVALLAVGVASAFAGERPELTEAAEKDHFSAEHRECGAEKSKYYDKHANNTVSLRSAVIATVTVEDGKFYAQAVGLKDKVDTISVPRSSPVAVMFRNKDEKEYRLVVNLGKHEVAETGVMEEHQDCTQLTGKNQEQILLLNIAKPAENPDEPYTFAVPGLEGEIKVVVP